MEVCAHREGEGSCLSTATDAWLVDRAGQADLSDRLGGTRVAAMQANGRRSEDAKEEREQDSQSARLRRFKITEGRARMAERGSVTGTTGRWACWPSRCCCRTTSGQPARLASCWQYIIFQSEYRPQMHSEPYQRQRPQPARTSLREAGHDRSYALIKKRTSRDQCVCTGSAQRGLGSSVYHDTIAVTINTASSQGGEPARSFALTEAFVPRT